MANAAIWIDQRELPGISSIESVELKAAGCRIAGLEAELATTKHAAELLREVVPPKGSSSGSSP